MFEITCHLCGQNSNESALWRVHAPGEWWECEDCINKYLEEHPDETAVHHGMTGVRFVPHERAKELIGVG
ncbi:hypothetical protein LCGC14_1713130 [marine sediment metagenome]|uniref:Uncharacterized protein n=1 Tax=marine sediment metagenome TaxID=412755 RepID=A0A0F9I205_9ZZZZ